MNEYIKNEREAQRKLAIELSNISGLKFEAVESGDDNRLDVILSGNIPIHVRGKDYTGKYAFFLRHSLPFVRYETEKKYREVNKEPQNVGVLNSKKIKTWVDYLHDMYINLEAISLERKTKVEDFLTEMKKQGANISEIDKYYNTCTGEIEKNGIVFKFQVYDEAYISQDIEISWKVKDNLETFLKLADNHYQK